MPNTTEQKLCNKPDCEIGITGVCVEGHEPLEACPFYGKTLELDDDLDDLKNAESDQDEDAGVRIGLPLGEALELAEVDEFLRRCSIRLITIVGDRESGKTTLVCSIYDRFLRGPFAGYRFAGSRTLIGLERRSHYSRIDSGFTRPDTPRTSLLEGLRFFHFAFVSENAQSSRIELMLSDRAGEMYRRARDNSKVVSELLEVAKADRLVLLLDGARLIIPAERSGAFQSVRQTLRAFLDGGIIGMNGLAQIVTTKVDLLEAQSESERMEICKLLDEFKQRLSFDFGNRLADLAFFSVSARDPDGKLAPAYDVDKLLSNWLHQTPHRNQKAKKCSLPLQTEFDLLLLRTPFEVSP